MTDDVTERLAAVERALTDDETALADLSGPAEVESRLDALETRLDAFEERLADVEGDIAAVRGHVGAAERVDRETEQIAQRALATARELEARLDDETPAPRDRPIPVEKGKTQETQSLVDLLRERW